MHPLNRVCPFTGIADVEHCTRIGHGCWHSGVRASSHRDASLYLRYVRRREENTSILLQHVQCFERRLVFLLANWLLQNRFHARYRLPEWREGRSSSVSAYLPLAQ